jgi:hypothetical protein
VVQSVGRKSGVDSGGRPTADTSKARRAGSPIAAASSAASGLIPSRPSPASGAAAGVQKIRFLVIANSRRPASPHLQHWPVILRILRKWASRRPRCHDLGSLGGAPPDHPRYSSSGHECQNPPSRPRHARANRSTTTRRARPGPRYRPGEGVLRNGRARTIALGYLRRPTFLRRFSLVDGHSTGSMSSLQFRKNRAYPWQIMTWPARRRKSCISTHPAATRQARRQHPKAAKGLRRTLLLAMCLGFRLDCFQAPLLRSALRATIGPRPDAAPRALTAGLSFSWSVFNRLDQHSDPQPPRFASPIVALMDSRINPVRDSASWTAIQPDR